MLISLSDLASDLQILSSEIDGYLNLQTGEAVLVPADEPDEAVLGSDEWIHLPSAFEFNDYRIMRDFCESVSPDAGGQRLTRAIRGSGAFRRFRAEIERLDLEPQWYAFRDAAYERFLAAWLTDRNLPFD